MQFKLMAYLQTTDLVSGTVAFRLLVKYSMLLDYAYFRKYNRQ